MTGLEFWRLAAPVVAHIKCGHTYIWFPESLQTQFETNTPFFPLEVRVLGKRAYAYRDYARAGSGLEGAELLSINGQPIKSILEQLRSVITGDGNTPQPRITALVTTAASRDISTPSESKARSV